MAAGPLMSSLRALYLHKPLFVLPFRIGFFIVLGVIGSLAAIFSALLWYEYAVSHSPSEQWIPFLVQALVQDALAVIAVIGAIGLFWDDRSLIKAHAICVFGHLIINSTCTAYFISVVQKACTPNTSCTSYKIPKPIYFVFLCVIIVIELYHSLVVVNFLHQLQMNETDAQHAVLAWEKYRPPHERLVSVESVHVEAPIQQPFNTESCLLLTQQLDAEAAEGYGGGRLRYNDISRDEKERLRQIIDGGDESISQMYMDDSRPVSRQEVVDLQLPSYHHVGIAL